MRSSDEKRVAPERDNNRVVIFDYRRCGSVSRRGNKKIRFTLKAFCFFSFFQRFLHAVWPWTAQPDPNFRVANPPTRPPTRQTNFVLFLYYRLRVTTLMLRAKFTDRKYAF